MHKNAGFRAPALYALAICLLLAVVLPLYTAWLRSSLQAEAVETLAEVSAQGVYMLEREIAGEFRLLQEIAANVNMRGESGASAAVDELKGFVGMYGFKRMGLITPDGVACTTDGLVMDLSQRVYFHEAMQGETGVSGTLADVAGGEEINVYSTPVLRDGRAVAVLFATYSADTFQQMLQLTSFGGKGYAYVINAQGEILVGAQAHRAERNIFSILEAAPEENAQSILRVKALLSSAQAGYVRIKSDEEKYMYCAPLNVNGWTLLNIVPVDVLEYRIERPIRMTYALCTGVALSFAGFLFYIASAHKRQERALMRIAYVDPVTGGYSYERFLREAQAALDGPHPPAAYVMMDVDRFKTINDLYGNDKGDDAIRLLWRTWMKTIRPGEVFAHRGADRFAAILFYEGRAEELAQRMEGLRCTLKEDAKREQLPLLPVTFGFYLITDRETGLDKMADGALLANRAAKESQGKGYAFFDEELRQRQIRRRRIEERMEAGLENGEFIAFYQPKFDMDGNMTGAEALVRWRQADGSFMPPDAFVPLFEQNGFIVRLDRYMFELVCRQLREWIRQGRTPAPVSVNLSRLHLYDASFVDGYAQIVEAYGIPPGLLQVEITESAMFDNMDILSAIIGRLHACGFCVLMDDFGTGYSSMAMLQRIRIDVLKIDKSFVDEIGDARGEKVIQSILWLARALDMEVTAEGVETKAQFDFLRDLGCDAVQGYYFARPMPAAEFEKRLGGEKR